MMLGESVAPGAGRDSKRRPTRMMELLAQLLVERPELRKGEKR